MNEYLVVSIDGTNMLKYGISLSYLNSTSRDSQSKKQR